MDSRLKSATEFDSTAAEAVFAPHRPLLSKTSAFTQTCDSAKLSYRREIGTVSKGRWPWPLAATLLRGGGGRILRQGAKQR